MKLLLFLLGCIGVGGFVVLGPERFVASVVCGTLGFWFWMKAAFPNAGKEGEEQ